MDELISVIIKEPGKDPERKVIKNTLEAMQKVVGGHIETVTLAENIVLIVNEEGLIHHLPYNCTFMHYSIYGPMMLVGVDGDSFCSLPYEIELTEGGK